MASRTVQDTATVAWSEPSAGQVEANVPDGGVSNAKLADMSQATIKGRASGAGSGDPTDLSASQVRTILNVEDGATADQTEEEIQDAAWNVLGGTQTLITVTYNDAGNNVSFVVDNNLANYDNSSAGFLTSVAFGDINANAVVTESEGIGSNDNDTTLPTSAAVKDYVDTNIGGGTVDTSGTPVATDYARFTDADTIEGRSPSEVRADLSLEVGTDVQAWDADLDTIAALSSADGNFIVGSASGWVVESGGTVRSSLGLSIGSDVQAHGDVLDDLNTLGAVTADSEFLVGTGAGAFAWESGATVRASLGLSIGSDVQAHGDVLDDLNTLGAASSDGEFIVATGAGAFAYESGATARTSLGLGDLATQDTVNDDDWSGTDLAVGNGGTGASDAATARGNLGVDASAIEFVIDGGGSEITTGVKGDIEVPFACTIDRVTVLADQSGDIVVDLWVDSFANAPPTDADSITASAPPTLSSAVKSQDSSLSGWTTSLNAGDIIRYNVDSITTVTRVLVSLKVTI